MSADNFKYGTPVVSSVTNASFALSWSPTSLTYAPTPDQPLGTFTSYTLVNVPGGVAFSTDHTLGYNVFTGLAGATTYSSVQILAKYTCPDSSTYIIRNLTFLSITTLPNEATNITYDPNPSGGAVNWQGAQGAIAYRVVPSGTNPLPQVLSQTNSSYIWIGLSSSTAYTGLLQSTADEIAWSPGVTITLTTLAPGALSITQTSSTISTAVVQVTPLASSTVTYTMTSSAGSVTPSGSGQPNTQLVYTNTGLAAGTASTMTYTASSGGGAVSQVVLARPPALPTPVANYDGRTGIATIGWGTLAATIAGSPYIFVSATPNLASEPIYPTATGFGSNQSCTFAVPPNVNYTFQAAFGQDDIGGTEGDIVNVAMAEYYIVSVINNVVTFNTFNTATAPTLTITGTGGPFNYSSVVSPFRIPSGVLTNGTTYTFRLYNGTTSSQEVNAKASSGGASVTYFFSP